MLLLATSLFNPIDIIAFPLSVLVMYIVGKIIMQRQTTEIRKYFGQAFRLRVIMVLAFTVVLEFYYGSGDSLRYYISMLDMRHALDDGAIGFWDLITKDKAMPIDPLYNYFFADELGENHYYMETPSNFAVPKIAVSFSYLFFNSYPAIAFIFSFFSLLGCLQIYKVFAAEFPRAKKQIAIACFFIPTVCFWSSGILKDSLTFGALGFLLNAIYSIFIRRRNYISSILIVAVSVYMLFVIKPYILLAFAPAAIILIFTSWSMGITSKTLKGLTFVFMFVTGLGAGILFYQNLTSTTSLQNYKTEIIFEQIDRQRSVYEAEGLREAGSSFSLGSDNIAAMFGLGIVAAYFRPFLWEVGSPIMALSAAESLLFLLLLLYVFIKVGFFRSFQIIFKHPLILFCFIFSILFGGAVGTSTGNFGSLVRYKIPGLPFILLLNMIILTLANIPLPAWVRRWFRIPLN